MGRGIQVFLLGNLGTVLALPKGKWGRRQTGDGSGLLASFYQEGFCSDESEPTTGKKPLRQGLRLRGGSPIRMNPTCDLARNPKEIPGYSRLTSHDKIGK